MREMYLATILGMLAATAVVARSGVINQAGKAHMDGMSGIRHEMKALGLIAKGKASLYAKTTQAFAVSIAKLAANTSTVIQAKEDAPRTEAKLAIWANFGDFAKKALNLESIAPELSKSIEIEDDPGPALQALGYAQNLSFRPSRIG